MGLGKLMINLEAFLEHHVWQIELRCKVGSRPAAIVRFMSTEMADAHQMLRWIRRLLASGVNRVETRELLS